MGWPCRSYLLCTSADSVTRLPRRLGSKVAQSKKAQRLLLLAYRRGGQTVQQPLLHAILRSCHEDEACCDDSDMLARCAQAVDLMPRDAALSFLKSEDLRCEVECMMREARDLGITATPSIVFGGKWAVTGAQSPNVYSRVRLSNDIWLLGSFMGAHTDTSTPGCLRPRIGSRLLPSLPSYRMSIRILFWFLLTSICTTIRSFAAPYFTGDNPFA